MTVVAHTFNPSHRKMEMGRDMTQWREEYKARIDRRSGFSLRFHRDGIHSETGAQPIWSEDFVEIRTSDYCSASLIFQVSHPNI